MNLTKPTKYRGYTYWFTSFKGEYRGYIEAAPKMITPTDETFRTLIQAEVFLHEQIDLACGDPVGYVSTRGFTLIEVLVVIAMVGILSAIAAPSWLAFTNNQRLRAANGKVFSAINEAKSKAKTDKSTVIAEFRQNGDRAEYAIYKNPLGAIWQTLDDVTVSNSLVEIDFRGNTKDVPTTVTVTNGNQKRCTSVITLLGATRQLEGAECP